MGGKNTDETVIEPEDIEDITASPEGESEDDDLTGLLAELGGISNAMVTVSRVNDKGRQEVVDRFHPRDIDLLAIRDQYGGGEYVLTGRRGNKIAKGFPKRVFLAERVSQPEFFGSTQLDRLAMLVENSIRQQNEQIQKIAEMALDRREDPDAARLKMLEEMKLMRDLFGGNNKSSEMSPDKVLELIQQGMEFGQKLSGKESGLFDVLKEGMVSFGKPLSMAIEKQMEAQEAAMKKTGHPGQPAGAPVGNRVVHQTNKTRQEQSEVFTTMSVMRKSVGWLVMQAAANSDTSIWADVIMEQVPEADLVAVLSQYDAVTYLGGIDKRVFDYREWFTELGDDLMAQLGIEPAAGDHVSEPGKIEQPTNQDDGPTGPDSER